MKVVWNNRVPFYQSPYQSEADLEQAILEVEAMLFGSNRFYLDVKKAIGKHTRNIPDGYLIDIRGRKPRLYVVENELAIHEPLKHIAVQLLEFSLAFEDSPHSVKKALASALTTNEEARLRCGEYASKRGYNSTDHLLEHLVFESPFAALVIIDEVPDKLEAVLTGKFKFGIEVLELTRYENANHEKLYEFEPFLSDVTGPDDGPTETDAPSPIDAADVDTIVIPARPDGFQETFLGENRWYAIRIHGSMIPQIKHIAAYQIKPIQAITHVANVASIEPWLDTDKYCVVFSEPAKEISPIKIGTRIRHIQSLRYTSLSRILEAKSIDDLW